MPWYEWVALIAVGSFILYYIQYSEEFKDFEFFTHTKNDPHDQWGHIKIKPYMMPQKHKKNIDVASDTEEEVKSYSPLEGFLIFNDYTFLKFTSQLFFNIFLNFFFIFLFILTFLIIFQNRIINLNGFITTIFNFFFDLFKNIITSIRLERFFFFLVSIFTVIIFFNFGGFSLHELSFTSHAFVTLFLSFIIFFNIFFNILVNFNSFFYKKFIQENLNIFLTVLLFVIELISFFIRPLSLGIRLFTNILAGHILIHIFFGFLLFLYNIIFWFSFLVFIFCNLILGLEIFVAIIQSYIFFVLSVVYLKDAFVLHG
jgi:ATP synthase subunit 6